MKRIDKLTHQQKMEIYNKHRSGQCYIKELCREFNIGDWTYRNVVKEIEELIRKELYGTKKSNSRT